MSLDKDGTWHPEAHHIATSQVTALLQRLGVASYEELLTVSVNEPARYWNVVMDFCGLVWHRRPERFVDFQAGTAFPDWFPDGQLNWVETVFAFARDPNSATRVAVVAEQEDGRTQQLSYAELAHRVENFAAGLASAGLGRGDRIGLLMENGVEATVSFLAIAHLGAIMVPLFSGFAAEAVISRLGAAGAQALVASTGFWRRGKWMDVRKVVEEARVQLPALKSVIWKNQGEPFTLSPQDHDWQALAATDGKGRASAIMGSNEPFMLIYTSGTTGKPKGAVHTHGNFPLKIAHDAAVNLEIGPGDVFCWPADMGWIAGSLVTCSVLLRGATLVCYSGSPDFPDWSRMSRIVERHRVTHFGSAPTLIRGMASNEAQALMGDRSSLQLLITAGEVIDPEHFCWFQQKFGGGAHPLINYTGGTEVSGGLLSSVVLRPIAPGAFNSIVPGVPLDVVDAQGQSVTDQVGELAMRGAFIGMTRSFWQDDERYLDTYWRTDEGLWIHGDLALRRADGSFLIMGRSDDTLKLAGKRVGPAEVEEVVLEVPGVSEVAAVGVEDPLKGQKLVILLGLHAEAKARATEIEAEVQSHVDQRLGRAFRPARVHAVSQLPKTRSSKIMRRLIRNAYAGLPLGDLTALDNPAAIDEIRALAARASDR
jgi:acetyl-CoA synthetase